MQLLLDHIASIGIAGLILLSLLVLHERGGDASIEATQFHTAKTRMLSLAEMVERDFTNIGSGVDSVQFAITKLDTVSVPATFAFQARTDTADASPHAVVYEWEADGSVEIGDSTYSTYSVKRIINGTTSGWSSGSITSFSIAMFGAAGNQITTNYADTRIITVSVSAVSTVGVGEKIEQSDWDRTFRPMNLTRTLN